MKKSLIMLPCILTLSILASAAGVTPIRSQAALQGEQSRIEEQPWMKEQKFRELGKTATGSDAGREEEENSDGNIPEEDEERDSGEQESEESQDGEALGSEESQDGEELGSEESQDGEELESEEAPDGGELGSQDVPSGMPQESMDAAAEEVEKISSSDANLISDIPVSEKADKGYRLCGYWFREMDWPLIYVIGEEFDEAEAISNTVEVYLDGPEGHMDDCFEVDVKWDFSGVDFTREGSYPVTGILDTVSFEYPVNWDAASPPAFTVEVVIGGTLSFAPEVNGNTLTLNYEMNGKPFSYSRISPELYESLDEGKSWNNISESKRVVLSEKWIRISGVTDDAMYQAVNLGLDYGYASCSDIVEVKAGTESLTVNLIASGGVAGGAGWSEENGSIWNPDCIRDGPYQILEYNRSTFWPSPLDVHIFIGEEAFFVREYYDEIWVSYGDYLGGYWHDKIKLPVQWDWAAVDAMDWSQIGATVVHGSFSEETMRENSDILDFDTMPELSFTISVIAPGGTFNLGAEEERILENNSVYLRFYDDNYEIFAFDHIMGMKVWCCVDGGDSWYNITGMPNVELTNDSLKVSYLRDDILRSKGYTFQLEQANPTSHERYSCALNICHGINGVYFEADVGGERGGGKRQEKPPQGLFDGEDPGGDMGEEPPPGPPDTVPDSGESKPSENVPETDPSRPSEPETWPVPDDTQPSGSGGNDRSESGGSSDGGSHGNPADKSVSAEEKRDEQSGMGSGHPSQNQEPGKTIAESGPAGQAAGNNGQERHPSTEAEHIIAEPEKSGPGESESEETEPEETKPEKAGPEEAEPMKSKPAETESAKTESAKTVGKPPSQVPATHSDLFRVAAGAAAVATGGIAGFWMIRRR